MVIRMVQIGIDHPHAAAYRGTLWALRDRIEVVGFLAREGDATRVTGPHADVPIYHSLDDLLHDTRPDAAQVMLRNNEMGLVLTKLAEEGIHLWAEKPIARRSTDLLAVRDLVNRKGLIFTAGYQSRFEPTTALVRGLVHDGLLGPLTFAHMTTATTTTRLRNPSGPLGYLFDGSISGGGIFHWLGCHMVDLLLYIVGEQPVAVSAMTANVGEELLDVEDIASVVLRFPAGWLASLNYGYLLPTKDAPPFHEDAPRPAIFGQQGWVRWSGEARDACVFSSDSRWAASPWQQFQFHAPPTGGYGNEALLAMVNFIDAVEGNATPMYRIEDAIQVLEVIEAAYESARTDRAISLVAQAPEKLS